MPLFGTPRDYSRETYGHEVAEVAKRLGKPLMPWQRYAADVALEIDPETGELWYEEVDITVPRQSGKSTLILALMVWRCVIMARRLGRQTVTYLAQKGNAARRKLEREFIPILNHATGFHRVAHSRARPVKPTDWKPSMNNGSEHILFGTDSYLQIAPPSETASHGDVLDMPVIDEAFSHQNDLVEQAVDAASVTRRSPQLYVISTAGNAKSRYLWNKVKAGRAAVKAGTTSRICYLEWGLPDDARYDDEEAWWKYLPALGHTISIQRLRAKLEKAQRNPDAAVDEGDADMEPGLPGFCRGYLNQWVEIPGDEEVDRVSKLDPNTWRATVKPKRQWPDRSPGKVTITFDVDSDGKTASISMGAGSISAPYVETLFHEQGTSWLPDKLVEVIAAAKPIAIGCNGVGNTAAMVGPIIKALQEAGLLTDIVQMGTKDYTAACAGFHLDVVEGRLIRPDTPQGALDRAAIDATERIIGDSWAWERRLATVPISPLVSATVARALLPVDPGKPYDIFAF